MSFLSEFKWKNHLSISFLGWGVVGMFLSHTCSCMVEEGVSNYQVLGVEQAFSNVFHDAGGDKRSFVSTLN